MKNLLLTAALLIGILLAGCGDDQPGVLKNLVLMIGDGMGPEQQKAGGCLLFGPDYGKGESQLSFELMPHKGSVTTINAEGETTDSAAAATAIATGHKVSNRVLSLAIPGDGSDLETLLEHFQGLGRSTGLVTTTEISHATPAGFGSHVEDRGDVASIVNDYLNETRPNLLMGGAATGGITPELAEAAGYTVVTDRSELQALTGDEALVSGQFSAGHMPFEITALGNNPFDTTPHLNEMARRALELLSQNEEGFFLLVEGGRIDHAAHSNALLLLTPEVVQFHETVQRVLEWSEGRNDTLVLVTADHETGGLQVDPCGDKGETPTGSWLSEDHTSTSVNLYASGVKAELIASQVKDNTDFFDLLTAD